MTPRSIPALAALTIAAACPAAPFAKWLHTISPNGAHVKIWGEGDEFSASFEAEDGHAVLFDTNRLCYVYASLDEATGALAPTSFAVGDETDEARAALDSTPKHLRDRSQAAQLERINRIAESEAVFHTAERWNALKAAARTNASPPPEGLLMAPPSQTTTGTITGLTLLIDFPLTNSVGAVTNTLANTYHPDITRDTIDELVNGENTAIYGNASSVRKYFEDVSCGKLSYTNIVLGYFLAKYPREYYDDPTVDIGDNVRNLIAEALTQINSSNSTFKAQLKTLSYTTSGNRFLALNVFYAGAEPTTWSKGLWPHKWELSYSQYSKLQVRINGRNIHFQTYQISPITESPSIGTFCHENGHMICDFPDLYDYNYGYGGAAGLYSLMNYSGEKNPIYVDAYLRAAAGWVTPKELPETEQWITISNRLDDVRKYTNPDNDSEYYLIENRQKSGRDADLPAGGIFIWRCDESGDNMYPTNLAYFTGVTTYRQSCELSLEQADGLYQLEQRSNYGDARDTWYSGNTAAKYTGIFHDSTTPYARWRDESASGMWLSRFSAKGDVMKFFSGPATTTTEIPVPYSWLDNYPALLAAAGGDYEAMASSSTGKTDGSGNALAVWQDYLAGTDPTDPDDIFTLDIEMDGSTPRLSWKPDLNANGVTNRIYTIFGKPDLSTSGWTVLPDSLEGFKFFKATVEMPE